MINKTIILWSTNFKIKKIVQKKKEKELSTYYHDYGGIVGNNNDQLNSLIDDI